MIRKSITKLEGITRREFLKWASRATLLTSPLYKACTTFNENQDWSQVPVEEFDLKAFERWYKFVKMYNGINHNLDWPHGGGYNPTFRDTLWAHNYPTPGIDHHVPRGEVMVAAAPGYVLTIDEIRGTGRPGGRAVFVNHGTRSPLDIIRTLHSQWRDISFVTMYAHLDKVFIHGDQKVERGDPIGNVTEHNNIAKMMAWEEGNWVDPNNYGLNHGFMDYSDGSLPGDENILQDLKVVDNKLQNQKEILDEFKKYGKRDKNATYRENYVFDKWHRKKNIYKIEDAKWSTFEKFRYLEELYKINPKLFPDLSKDQFESMRKEFYDNQPIILTLPFKKGGMKRY